MSRKTFVLMVLVLLAALGVAAQTFIIGARSVGMNGPGGAQAALSDAQIDLNATIAANVQANMTLTLSVLDGAANTDYVNRWVNAGQLHTTPTAGDIPETGSSCQNSDFVFHIGSRFGRYISDSGAPVVAWKSADDAAGRNDLSWSGGVCGNGGTRSTATATFFVVARVVSYINNAPQTTFYDAPSFFADGPVAIWHWGIGYSTQANPSGPTTGVAFHTDQNGYGAGVNLAAGISDTTTYHVYVMAADSANVLGKGANKWVCYVDGSYIGTLTLTNIPTFATIEMGANTGNIVNHRTKRFLYYNSTLSAASIASIQASLKSQYGTP